MLPKMDASIRGKKGLAFFHHKRHNSDMKVVEKDRVIGGMLSDEMKRCQDMLKSLEKPLSGLPKGVISERKKRYKDKVYFYHYLKYRSGEKVINKHIPKNEVREILKELERRKKIEKEIQIYKNKIAYLKKVLSTGKRRRHKAGD